MARFRSKYIKILVVVGLVYAFYLFVNVNHDENINGNEPRDDERRKPMRNEHDIPERPRESERHVPEKQEPEKNEMVPAQPVDIPEPPAFDKLVEKFASNKHLKDWHNYQQIAAEAQRQGPGEQGAPYVLTPEDAKSPEKSSLLRANGFNALVSDKISLQRSLNDIRHPDCKKKLYLDKLPKVSVVIPFHNEHFSTLLRSVYSIVNRSPPELLEEIILVDDFSDKDFLKKKLEDFIESNFKKDLVKVLRLSKREGLIRTRMAGARIAKAEVLIFFDSHIECNVNWLPPLIEPIAQNKTTAVCPFIDVIGEDTFAYTAQDNGARGAFDWGFFYKRLPLLKDATKSPTDPFDDPVMAGGLFAIDKEWFFKLGGYDEGLEFWGGEQYELSFKIWQCGGTLVDAPCSRVGHIYRKFNPFSYTGRIPYLANNYKRVAEVWMDEYKEFIYDKQPSLRSLQVGDLSAQHELRKTLQCKSFKWFMESVAFDLPQYYPPKPVPPYAEGEIRSVDGPDLCIDTKYKAEEMSFGLDTCISKEKSAGGEQHFEFTFRSEIKPSKRNVCFDVSQSNNKSPILLFSCHGYRGNQEFQFNLKTSQIFHPISGLCIDSNKNSKELYMSKCDPDLKSQQWIFQTLNTDLIKKAKFKINLI